MERPTAGPPPVLTAAENVQGTAPAPSFPVVGIGASAGGLEAETRLLRALPKSPGMALVIVQHLDPRHDSNLAVLLSHVSAMPVLEASEGMLLEADHAYVIPPNAGMILRQGVIHLNPRGTTRVPQRPIDQFLCSLAQERGCQSIAVILSGTGSDGALGLEAVKAEGGITFAQDGTASYSGMPQSAIAAGGVDFVLSPERIAQELLRIGKHPYVICAGDAVPDALPAAKRENALNELFLLLRRACGIDFALYKQTTIRRRIDRRMVVHRMDYLADYVALLRKDPAETQALCQDVLIHVTSFFRDASTFEALRAIVFPALMKGRPPDAPIRIWVPGCSTGEEVYSLAITLLEFLEDQGTETAIKLFGTDVSEAVVIKARSGRYAESISSDVSPERLLRFFVRIEGGYQISKAVRDLCVFARQDASRDPPFSNLDLISCRNLLIYLGPVLQQRLLPILHYALKDHGFLVLGRSETVGSLSDLFSVVDGPRRIYGRRSGPSRLMFDFPGRGREVERLAAGPGRAETSARALDVQREADRVVLSSYAPAGVVIDDDLEILQFRGDTGPYLSPAPGTPSHNLLKMVREGLLPNLRAAIAEAKDQNGAVRREGLQVMVDGQELDVNLVVVPIRVSPSSERRILVLFENTPRPVAPPATGKRPRRASKLSDAGERVARLERELQATKEYLQEIIEKQGTSTEELLAANQEILSGNEELQTTNEELQTAKEELQATNEELMTTNEELQSRNAEAARLNNDLTNLITSVSIPIVMMDRNLRIRRVTPNACTVMNLRLSDVGRPITDINLGIEVPDLEGLLRTVVDTRVVKELEIQDRDGCWYLLCIRPYRTPDDSADGVVITLSDVDAIKRTEQQANTARDYAESIVMTVREPLVVLDGTLRIRTANRAFHQLFRTEPAGAEKHMLWELGSYRGDATKLQGMLEAVRRTGTSFEDLEIEADVPSLGRRSLLLNARKVHRAPEEQELVLLAIEDVTDRRREEAAALALEQKIQDTQKLESLGILAGGIAHDFNNILTGILGNATLAEMDSPPDSSLRPYLKRIEKGAEHAADLCAQMLAYAGRGRFVVNRLDLSAFVRDTIHLLRLSVNKKAVFSFDLATDLPVVLADATQIRQVLMNLVTNASEAIGDQSGNITIATGLVHADPSYLAEAVHSPGLPAGDYVYLEVADDGCGMSAETKARMFDPFFTTKFKGRGLGLAAVQGIVRGHRGVLRVDSHPGRGSTIRLLLPRAEPLAMDPPRPPTETPSWRGTGTVLVVDDEDVVRTVVTGMLEVLGFQVLQARDGLEGLEVFRAHANEINLVLLDLTMPHLSGEETFHQLRQIRPDIRVVLMSGYDEQDVVSRFAGQGLGGFLPKPFRLSDLATRLKSTLAL